MGLIVLGQYLPGSTPLHRLDPRVKILGVLLLSLLTFAAASPQIALLTAFVALLSAAGRVPPRRLAAAIRPVAPFMALLFALHLLLSEGPPLLDLSPLPLAVTGAGLVQGAYVVWQFATLVTAAALLTLTTPPSDLVAGIERLLRPLRRLGVPTAEIALMISLALRFLPLLMEEYDRIRTAQLARGADFSGGWRRRIRSAAALALPLLLAALRRADDLIAAMEARGYRPGPRTTLRELAFTRRDGAALALLALLALADAGLGGWR